MNPQSLLLAVAFEIGAAVLLLKSGNELTYLASFLASHAAASALFGLTLYPLLPAAMRTPRVPVLALLMSLCFFLPLLGALALSLALLTMRFMPLARSESPWRSPLLPELLLALPERARRLRELSLGPLLQDAGAAAALRSRALNALSTMPLRASTGLLRKLLADPVEDLRLVAYGILDSSEKTLRQRIDTLERLIAEAPSGGAATAARTADPARTQLHRALAELHFELTYQGLVHGDLRVHELSHALLHVEVAMQEAPEEPGLHYLRARIHLAEGASQAARADLERALALGLPRARVLPHLAELAFAEGEWTGVRTTMRQLPPQLATPRIAGLARLWAVRGALR